MQLVFSVRLLSVRSPSCLSKQVVADHSLRRALNPQSYGFIYYRVQPALHAEHGRSVGWPVT